MTLPNFLLIGAPKCGTTSIYHYLRQHPDVFMPDNKEPWFFAYEGGMPSFNSPHNSARVRNTVTDLPSYEGLFAGVTTERAIGEASIIYLYSPEAPPRIRRYVPDAKLIAVLRDPVDRAFSNFQQQRRFKREPLSEFGDALAAEPARMADNWGPFWHYAALGRYHSQLQRYHRLFDPKNIRVYLYDDLKANPLALLRDMFRFLDVDDGFVPDVSRRYLASSRPRVPALRNFIRTPYLVKDVLRPFVPDAVRRVLIEREAKWNRTRLTVDTRVRARLVREYKSEIAELEILLGRDLSSWRQLKPKR